MLVRNTASVYMLSDAVNQDPDPSNNEAVATVPINGPADVSITIWSCDLGLALCQYYYYTIEVENHGPDVAYDVCVVDELPYMFERAHYSLDCEDAWKAYEGPIHLDKLAVDEKRQISFRVFGGAGVYDAPIVYHVACVDAGTYDPNAENNTALLRTHCLRY
jgi:hypothetical protein